MTCEGLSCPSRRALRGCWRRHRAPPGQADERDCKQPLGFIGIVELPSLPERPVCQRMQGHGQWLDHSAGESGSAGSACARRRCDG
jgi:hypothetical protein